MPGSEYHSMFEEDWDELRPKIQFAASYKEKWQNLIPLFEQISAHNAVFIMVWNMTINRIIYMVDKKNVIGYDASNWLAENWADFSSANIPPKFIHAAGIMQREGIKYYLEKGNDEPEKFVINLEGIYKRATGEYFHFLQQSVCIEKDSKGNPFIFLSYLQDITYLKKPDTANLVITTPKEIKCWNFNFDKNCLEPVQPLSKQEKKILAFLAEGKSSKEIAKELFISSSTVDTHRRNLLKKTNCLDTTGMITYTKLVGLL